MPHGGGIIDVRVAQPVTGDRLGQVDTAGLRDAGMPIVPAHTPFVSSRGSQLKRMADRRAARSPVVTSIMRQLLDEPDQPRPSFAAEYARQTVGVVGLVAARPRVEGGCELLVVGLETELGDPAITASKLVASDPVASHTADANGQQR